ncbi:bifunctional dttp/utp pyrophosphatase/methyltransferase protein-related [Holotrichia oblita]|uniref:Bifunctional dttp/utp pyrophosphatase/methyltransferase protein-related n=2 Tax=Holotrichia oblita TaxID=644536 RepID=A0ACB9TFV3_HOLOL|nr:bifunctional dttp/utp pyrophosphatase/methyltransferase protein-related [Holotrichia oblita]KAI4465693.1 bifunctional dttp/utp pyrophosphatase/methyltransferase protein-related [Holotrichia oblita]
MFGKPNCESEAVDIIRRLTSGKPHHVYTGVVFLYRGTLVTFTETTKVFMEQLTEEEILAYVKTGEPIGKAGAYAIQGLAASFISKIEGDYNNVVGLPLYRITFELKKLLL